LGKKIHEFIVAVGIFGGIGIMIVLTMAGSNGTISKAFFFKGMAIAIVITYICIKQLDKHFDGQEWK